ncbi:glycine cleavage system H-protein subunit [Malassezia cuniculi]|uniref:Glycine cleavage system H protein n=1 Tax=Malassezia cuniculi TaxID=948313 RepID=A0AAF0EQ95_9BASI|nr:glycine cleavage system H-protein subunit [Malassezia cuniculi]
MIAAPLRKTCFSAFAIASRAAPRAVPVRMFQTSSLAAEIKKRYTVEHEWIAYDDATNVGTLGITDHAQNSLGDVVFVEVPKPDTEVSIGDQIGFAESIKAVSDIYAPVSGTIAEVNDALSEDPTLLNKSAEADGWLAKIKLSNPSELDELLTEEAYKELLH